MTVAPGPAPVVETDGLGKRFGRRWALEDCTVRIPAGSVSALVGPNGAGKTTLLRMLVGLSSPTAGRATVAGRAPQQTREFLSSIAFLAQDAPLYRRFTVGEHLELGARLNPGWDAAVADERLARLGIPFDQPTGTLSGGERSQVALSLALAKRPELLVLDEPVASLDPLARRSFLATLAEAVAAGGLSVLMSSHHIHDLERICDHLVVVTASRTRLCEDIESLLARHRMLVGPRRPVSDADPGMTVVAATQTQRQSRWIVRLSHPPVDPSWSVEDLSLEDVVLAYMGGDRTGSAAGLSVLGAAP